MKPSAPESQRPLTVAGPQDPTQSQIVLRRRPAPSRLQEERTSLNPLPHLRTMLYAIPAESRNPAREPPPEAAVPAPAPRLRPGVLALCALLTGGALALALQPYLR